MPAANVPNLCETLLDDALEAGMRDTVAIREPKRGWTYGRLAEEVGRVASMFLDMGLVPGERVGLLLHDSLELAATFLGAVRAGLVPTPISVLLRPLEIRDLLRDAGAVAVVAHADLAPAIEAVRKEVPSLRSLLAVGGARPGQLDLHALLSEADADFFPVRRPADAPAFLLYSGGPQGPRRGVPHRHESPMLAFRAYAESVLALGPTDRVFTTSSLASAFGLGLGLLFPLLARGSTFLLPGRPRPAVVFDVMSAFQPTVFAATPSLYAQLVHDYRAMPAPRPACFSSVRAAVSGAEALPSALDQRFFATFGQPLLHGFGATEALHFVLSNRPDARRDGSTGRLLPGFSARVVGDEGEELGKHEIGFLEISGPTIGDGGSGWLRSGDRFFTDEEGFFFHCGRSDDLFKVSGRWVAPEEVERTLREHPAVWECAVIEGHDDDGLARPVAYVVPNVGHAPTFELGQDLMSFVKREIAPYKYPRQVEFVNELPRASDGRIQRWRLGRSKRT